MLLQAFYSPARSATRAEQLRNTGTASVQAFETREMEPDVAASGRSSHRGCLTFLEPIGDLPQAKAGER